MQLPGCLLLATLVSSLSCQSCEDFHPGLACDWHHQLGQANDVSGAAECQQVCRAFPGCLYWSLYWTVLDYYVCYFYSSCSDLEPCGEGAAVAPPTLIYPPAP